MSLRKGTSCFSVLNVLHSASKYSQCTRIDNMGLNIDWLGMGKAFQGWL